MVWKGFQRPKRLEVDQASLTDTFGRFHAQPFERGFGITIGNALRRILLSAIEGAAVTAVKIDGVLHEFSSIPGVVEDTTDIVLNAVHPEAQGQGIYGRLLDRGLALCRAAGQARVTVSTQLPNLPVQRAWVRRGFRLERSLYTLHKWFD